MQLAWRKRGVPSSRRRSLFLALTAFLVWGMFIIASIFVSEIASKTYNDIRTILDSTGCGFVEYNTSTLAGNAYANIFSKQAELEARTYASNWYSNSSSSLTTSTVFPSNSLPISTHEGTNCPVDPSFCLSPFPSFSITTPLLDSHEMFGINAPRRNRVQIQKNATCANIAVPTNMTKVNNGTLYVYLGPLAADDANDTSTYLYDMSLPRQSLMSIGYTLE